MCCYIRTTADLYLSNILHVLGYKGSVSTMSNTAITLIARNGKLPLNWLNVVTMLVETLYGLELTGETIRILTKSKGRLVNEQPTPPDPHNICWPDYCSRLDSLEVFLDASSNSIQSVI